MFCPKCGKQVNENAEICIFCGHTVAAGGVTSAQDITHPNKETALVLCLVLGNIGLHRFYTGHIAIGIAQAMTFGACGIWTLIDLISIISGNFKTADGKKLN